MTEPARGGRPPRTPPPERPYVLLSDATSADGYLDDTTGTRLILSSDADLDRVDEVRAGCDAIMVGAGTIRRDNPALLVRSPARRDGRAGRGLEARPARVWTARAPRSSGSATRSTWTLSWRTWPLGECAG